MQAEQNATLEAIQKERSKAAEFLAVAEDKSRRSDAEAIRLARKEAVLSEKEQEIASKVSLRAVYVQAKAKNPAQVTEPPAGKLMQFLGHFVFF